MALKLPKGIQFGFASVLADIVAASAFSKAAPAVATVPTGAVDAGEVVLVQLAGWPLLNNKIAVAGDEVAGALPLLGTDTTDATLFRGTSGAGSLLIAGEFVDYTQQGDPSSSGGDQQYWTGTLLEDLTGRQISIPTTKNAKTLTLPLYYDPKLPWYSAAKAADARGEPVVLRAKIPGGDVLYWYGYMSFDGDPSIASNTPMGNTMTFTALSESTLVEAD
ncbi:MAG TPA: phage tail protein [Stenotrophomonas sp.]|nr:phage tail protein [Stenotrophomonas sp.]